jgi:hypothetical protein
MARLTDFHRQHLHSTVRRQQQQWKETQTELFARQLLWEWKTLWVSASIYSQASGTATAGWISIGGWLSGGCLTLQLLVVDALYLGSSATTVRSPGWWQDSRATQDTFYNQDDPSIWEEVLDSRLGSSVPVSFGIHLTKTCQDRIKAFTHKRAYTRHFSKT